MTLDELKIQVAMDLKVNDERLDTESLKNQELYAKYLDIKSNFELLMYKAKGDYKILYRDKWEYYGGKADAKVCVLRKHCFVGVLRKAMILWKFKLMIFFDLKHLESKVQR